MRKQAITALAVLLAGAANATVVTGSDWSRFDGPSHPNLTGRRTFELITGGPPTLTWFLEADGDVPASARVGYASINADRVGQASRGFYFDSAESFSVSVRYLDFFFSDEGAAFFGLRIGRSIDGADSAGVELRLGGGIDSISAVGSVGGIDVPGQLFAATSRNSEGVFSVGYDAATSHVTTGWGEAPLGPPEETRVLTGVGSGWADGPLFAWFYVRSEGIRLSGAGAPPVVIVLEASVLSGTPIRIPEPTTAALLSVALAASLSRRR